MRWEEVLLSYGTLLNFVCHKKALVNAIVQGRDSKKLAFSIGFGRSWKIRINPGRPAIMASMF